MAGWSAGGRVALALAARHPELVGRAGVIAAPAPDEEVPWYGDENRAMVDALRGLPGTGCRRRQLWPGVGHLVVVPAWRRVLEHMQ